MKGKHLLMVMALAMLPNVGVLADQLTPEEALGRVTVSQQSRSKALSTMRNSANKLVYTSHSSKLDKNCFYVFQNASAGYMIVSADDIATPLLGYVETGSFDINTISPEMKWWLEEYQRQIEWSLANPATDDDQQKICKEVEATADYAAIEPLVKTKWNQDDPYYLQTPQVDGAQCMTGCMATAMAQIAAYHKYPACGTGSITYTYNETEYSYNFEEHPFDWDNMLNTYTGSESEECRNAVATLMAACGYSVQMMYGTDESGAYNYLAPGAFVDYLGYSPEIKRVMRECYKLKDWNKLVYDELAAGRPILYTGQSTSGGHAFVCDGYSENGYFHINWGWGGSSDGYFLLNALDPTSLGIGAGAGGYNYSQEIVMQIQPNRADAVPAYTLYSNNLSCSGTSLTAETGYVQLFTSSDDGLQNLSASTFDGGFGLRFENLSTDEVTDVYLYDLSIEPGLGFYNLAVYYDTIKDAVENGDYKVTVVYKANDQWYPVDINVSNNGYLLFTVADAEITITTPSSDNGVAISNITCSKQLAGQIGDVEFDATVSGYYSGSVYAYLFSYSEDSGLSATASLGSKLVELEDTTEHVKLQYTVPDSTGDYYVAILYSKGGYLYYASDLVAVTIGTAGTISVPTFMLTTDNGTCCRSNIPVSGTVSATDGDLRTQLTFYIVNESYGILNMFTTDVLDIASGETVDYSAVGSFPSGNVGTTYYIGVGQNYSLLYGNLYQFVLAEDPVLTGVEAVAADAESYNVYTTTGIRVLSKGTKESLKNLTPGIYIINNRKVLVN